MSSVADADRASSVRAIAERCLTSDRGPLLPILHELVAGFGYVDRQDVVVIADVLNLSVADVHGVVTFYHDFRTTPPAEHEVRLCRGEACQAVGAEALFAGTTTDVASGALGGDVSLESERRRSAAVTSASRIGGVGVAPFNARAAARTA